MAAGAGHTTPGGGSEAGHRRRSSSPTAPATAKTSSTWGRCHRNCGSRSSTRSSAASMPTAPAPHRDRSNHCWTISRSTAPPSRCWTTRCRTGWPDCPPPPRPPHRGLSSASRSTACSTSATEPDGTANTRVMCGYCDGSASRPATAPGWTSHRCSHAGCGSLPNAGADGVSPAASGLANCARISSRSYGCRG